MAQNSSEIQQYVEMEYILTKYFNEHCASLVNNEVKHFSDMQRKEFLERGSGKGMEYFNALNPEAAFKYASSGDWSRRTSEDLVKSIREKMSSDKKIASDISYLAAVCRIQMKEQLGEKEYARLSKGYPSGDMALDYVNSRFAQMTVSQLAKSKMPKGSFEYVVRNGLGGSLMGTFGSMMYGVPQSELDKRIEALADEMYNPSAGEVAAAIGTAVATDVVFTGGLGGAVSGVRSAATRAGTAVIRRIGGSATKAEIVSLARPALPAVAGEGGKAAVVTMGKSGVMNGARKYGLNAFYGMEIADAFLTDGQVDADKVVASVSLNVFKHKEVLDSCKQSADTLKANRSKTLHEINDGLQQKVKIPSYHVPFSPTQQTQFQKQVTANHGGDLALAVENTSLYLERLGVKPKEGEVPAWMMGKSGDELLRMSDYYMGLAMEMNRSGAKQMKKGSETFTMEQAAQRSYQYVQAVDLQRRQAIEAQRQEQETAVEEQSAGEATEEENTEDSTLRQQMSESQNQWGGLMEALGLKGAGDLSHNLGYTLSMLPDMIFGMLTGKTQNLKIEDNIFPLMAIFGGMFMKNPLLKWLLIGLGSVNLLNKGFGEMSGRDAAQQQTTVYRKYPDEPVSPRVKFHSIAGDQLVVDIDGEANIVRISADTARAYHSGSLSEGALCNAVLRQYDAFKEASRRQYELDARQTEERQVVRMGVG